MKLDIIDTQAHIGPGGIEETLSAMNALGIRGLLIDEYWLQNFFAYDPHEDLGNGVIRPICPTAEDAAARYPDRFAWVLALGKLPNVYLKWAHFSTMFELPAFPGEGLQPILRKTIDAFGANRIVWASDFSVNQSGDTWGELLYSVLGDSDLSASERSAILGANARRLLSWE